jgi:hypothetical protein
LEIFYLLYQIIVSEWPILLPGNGQNAGFEFRNMTQQKTAWFVQYKDNREIIVVKRIICYLNPFTITTKFFISILK